MDVQNKRLFRVLACCELMQNDHVYEVRHKGEKVPRFVKGGPLRFLTLTVKEHRLPLRQLCARFRSLSNSRWWRKLMKFHSYVAVYEPHPNGHGWHIHILTNTFIPWQQLQLMANAYLFGTSQIEAADTTCAFYIAKYVTKAQVMKRAQESKHVRIVNVSRDLLPLCDIECHSPSADYIRRHWRTFDGVRYAWQKLFCLYYKWVYTWSGVDFISETNPYELPF